jgi:hypothetical protein
MMNSKDGGAHWTIQPIAIPLAQPLCNGDASTTLRMYEYVSPQLVAALEPGLVTLIYGERQYCEDSTTGARLRAVTFDPALIVSQPNLIGTSQTLDSTTGSQYIGYGSAISLSPSEYLFTYEKGCPLAYCFVSQNALTATVP